MHSTHTGVTGARQLRVRDQVRETLAVMTFSAGASGLMALSLLLLGTLGR